MYSSSYQPQFFTQQRPAGQHQSSKFPPASQPGVHSSSMSLSQSFSQPQPQLQPSPYSQLPPSSAVQRPGSAGAQGRFLTSKGLCASQPMTQLSEEQLFLSNTQMRNPAALRPRSAAFAELSNSSARASNSQMGSPLTASQNGVVKDVLQELERKQQASLTAQQKQFDSIEKQQTSILDYRISRCSAPSLKIKPACSRSCRMCQAQSKAFRPSLSSRARSRPAAGGPAPQTKRVRQSRLVRRLQRQLLRAT